MYTVQCLRGLSICLLLVQVSFSIDFSNWTKDGIASANKQNLSVHVHHREVLVLHAISNTVRSVCCQWTTRNKTDQVASKAHQDHIRHQLQE